MRAPSWPTRCVTSCMTCRWRTDWELWDTAERTSRHWWRELSLRLASSLTLRIIRHQGSVSSRRFTLNPLLETAPRGPCIYLSNAPVCYIISNILLWSHIQAIHHVNKLPKIQRFVLSVTRALCIEILFWKADQFRNKNKNRIFTWMYMRCLLVVVSGASDQTVPQSSHRGRSQPAVWGLHEALLISGLLRAAVPLTSTRGHFMVNGEFIHIYTSTWIKNIPHSWPVYFYLCVRVRVLS